MSEPVPRANDRQGNLAIVHEIIDANRYLTLATSNQDGTPWLTPVYYTPDRYTDFYWISAPDATHSRNIGQRAEVSIVIFDSHVAVGSGQAVYLTAVAEQIPDAALPDLVGVAFLPRFPGVRAFRPEQLMAPAPHRLYRARTVRRWILDPRRGPVDSRIEVPVEAR